MHCNLQLYEIYGASVIVSEVADLIQGKRGIIIYTLIIAISCHRH